MPRRLQFTYRREFRAAVAIAPRAVVSPQPRGIVTTGYATRCTVDLAGIERCY